MCDVGAAIVATIELEKSPFFDALLLALLLGLPVAGTRERQEMAVTLPALLDGLEVVEDTSWGRD